MPSSSSLPSEAPLPPTGSEVERWTGRLFGAFRLISPDGMDATPTGRKARALVAYLMAGTDEGTTREQLAGLLWSQRGDDQARASLRQVFQEIRTLTSGDAPPIAIDRTRAMGVATRITTDSACLEEAAQADDVVALIAAIGRKPGDFLSDLDGIDPAFDDWLSIERTRRHDARRRALLGVAGRRLAADDTGAARDLSDRLLACDPSDEAAARIAMQASHRCGDRDAVRRHYANLVEALRRDVGVRPSAETEQIHRSSMAVLPSSATVPIGATGDDERHRAPAPDDADAFVPTAEDSGAFAPTLEYPGTSTSPAKKGADHAAITAAGKSKTPSNLEPEQIVDWHDGVSHPAPPRRPRRRTWLAAAVALLTVATVELVGWRHAGVASQPRVLLVEPMHAAPGDAAAATLSIGFGAELARMIVGKPAFVVRDADQRPDEMPERTFLIAADSQSEAGVLHVGLRLLARQDGATLWSTTLSRPVGEVAALREQMAARVADVVTCALDGRHTDLRAFRSDTLQLLVGACDLRENDDAAAANLLQQLTRQMPEFGHGWALLAEASAGDPDPTTTDANGTGGQAATFAQRALEFDPHDGDAYLGRAFALKGIARWPQRMAILREGLAMDPDHGGLAWGMAYELVQLGYLKQAIAWSGRAVHAEPFSPFIATAHAQALGLAGHAFGPEANAAFAAARRRFGSDTELVIAEFRFQALFGDYLRAAQMLADPNRGSSFHPARAALWAALIATRAEPSAAHDAEAERAFAAGMRAIPVVSPWTLEELSFLHRVDLAYAYADRMDGRSSTESVMASLFSDTNRPLRVDPRFMTLAARLGLAAIWQKTNQWPDFCSEPDLGYDCRVEAARALSADPRPLVAQR